MLIPVRCFTCGEILGDKWKPFIKICNDMKNKDDVETDSQLDIQTIDLRRGVKKSVEAKVLDKMHLKKMCCRRMMLTTVPLITYVN